MQKALEEKDGVITCAVEGCDHVYVGLFVGFETVSQHMDSAHGLWPVFK